MYRDCLGYFFMTFWLGFFVTIANREVWSVGVVFVFINSKRTGMRNYVLVTVQGVIH